MALSPPVPRDESHRRDLTLRGYRRADGLFDIEGRLVDSKTESFQVVCGGLVPALQPLHDIQARLTVDLELRVLAAEACSVVTPYRSCQAAERSVLALVGRSMASGWSRTVREHVGGAIGCAHLAELLLVLGATAFQTLVPYRRGTGHDALDARDASGRPRMLDTCVSFAAGSDIARTRWPERSKAGDKGL